MNTALLVIDVQKIYTDPESEMKCQDSHGTVSRINKLIEKFNREGHPIFYVRHIHKKDGSDLGRMFDASGEVEDPNFIDNTDEVEYDKDLIRVNNAIEIIKNRYNAFANTKLHEQLKRLNIEKISICGFMTNFCCESTTRSAHDLDYYVDFILDATGTPGTENINESKMRDIIGELLDGYFARVFTTEEYLA